MSALTEQSVFEADDAILVTGFGLALGEADVSETPGGPMLDEPVPLLMTQLAGRMANSEEEIVHTMLLTYEAAAELVARLIVDVSVQSKDYAALLSAAVAQREMEVTDNPSPLPS